MKTILSLCCATAIAAAAGTLSPSERTASIVDQEPTKTTIAQSLSLHHRAELGAISSSQRNAADALSPRTYIGATALTNPIVGQLANGPAIFGLFGAAALTGVVAYRRFWLGREPS